MREIYIKYGSMIVIGLLLLESYNIIRPFILPIATAAVLAYIFFPVYRFILIRTKNKNISALLMCLLVFLIVGLPIFIIINRLVGEVPAIYSLVSGSLENTELWRNLENIDFGNLNISISQLLSTLSSQLIRYIQGLVSSVPRRIISGTISAFFLFFFFRDGVEMLEKLLHYMPFKRKDTIIILREMKQMTDAVVYGQLITAVVQAGMATLGYTILGIKAPLLWGLITLFFSLIPLLGPAFVYVPISLSLLVTGVMTSETFTVVRGVILLIYGFGFISSVDNIIKPLLISDKVKIHPVLILLGVIGGLASFGVIGVVLGPLIFVFLITLFNLYEMKENILEKMDHQKRK